MSKSTKGPESSAPRPVPPIPPNKPAPTVIHHGQVSTKGTAAQDGWKHK
jgi:hypothetical protein